MLRGILSLNPNRSWASRLTSLKHQIWLMFETIFITSVLTALWVWCFKHKWPFHIHHEGVLVMLSTAILFCSAFFVFIAALLFAEVRERNRKRWQAVMLGDKTQFMLLRDEKVQIMMQVVLAFVGAVTLTLFGIADYTDVWYGGCIIFGTTAVVVVYFVAMSEMQNIDNHVSVQSAAPRDWLIEDIEGFFFNHRGEKAIDAGLKTAESVLTGGQKT